MDFYTQQTTTGDLQRKNFFILVGKPISQYVSYSLIFSPLYNILNGEQHEKYLCINPTIMENTECLIVKTRTSFINSKVGVA